LEAKDKGTPALKDFWKQVQSLSASGVAVEVAGEVAVFGGSRGAASGWCFQMSYDFQPYLR